MKVINIFKIWLHNNRFYKYSEGFAAEEKEYSEIKKLPALTEEEISLIKERWNGVKVSFEDGLSGFAAYKYNVSFSSEYIPMCYFYPWIVRVLNPIDASRIFSNKGMTYVYFKNVKQPQLIVRRLNGTYLNETGDMISREEAVSVIASCKKECLFKLSYGSCCGKSIQKLPPSADRHLIDNTIDSYHGDFVVQACLTQSPITAEFNPTSLNTFRISTLLLNGKFSICTAMLRFGTPGSVVDNIGAGGACIGINDDGTLMPYGYKKGGDKIESWNNVVFKGSMIPNFEKVINTAKCAHLNIPQCAFVGWDLAIDENGDVNLIEANIDAPGLFFEQLANARPAFRDRFDEVINYLKELPLSLSPMNDVAS